MKEILLFMLLLFIFSSCSRKRIYEKYPNCREYFDFIEKSWTKKNNGFFIIKEIPDTTKSEWTKYIDPPQFKQQWDKYKNDCICRLTEKEVVKIFGEPTRKGETYNVIKKITTTSYGYHIADEFCDEEKQKDSEIAICSSIGFTFWEGKQGRKYLPLPHLTFRNRK